MPRMPAQQCQCTSKKPERQAPGQENTKPNCTATGRATPKAKPSERTRNSPQPQPPSPATLEPDCAVWRPQCRCGRRCGAEPGAKQAQA
eukprot:5062584-Lingulodinium_polyedra.AAC.1